MDLSFFEDQIFDLINECDEFDITQIITQDRENRFIVVMKDGAVFEVVCEKIPVRLA